MEISSTYEKIKEVEKIDFTEKKGLISIKIPPNTSDEAWKKWLEKNSSYIVDQNETNIIIDMDSIGDVYKQVDWLQDNDQWIDFVDSAQYIYDVHRIILLDVILFIENRINSGIVTAKGIVRFQDIISKINNHTDSNGVKASYSFNYDHYVKFNFINDSITAPYNNIDIEIIKNSDYTEGSNCYSIPFLKIIEGKFSSSVELEFNKIEFLGREIIIFKIDQNTVITYYDYSHNPKIIKEFIVYFFRKFKNYFSKKFIDTLK